jgi:hypothetical protein
MTEETLTSTNVQVAIRIRPLTQTYQASQSKHRHIFYLSSPFLDADKESKVSARPQTDLSAHQTKLDEVTKRCVNGS